ncbi:MULTISPECIES: YraN family protein [Paenibacillus]|uniref:YraN family protein n=1 Tax=Paenibacillus TaxID=44249 RepID=UPI0004F744F9|nr:YraN family protein [Paenibacillus odorifer]AIQ75103.1 endonuclease [Paenibacillus odorifer]MEC0133166.1 YraN family protein [Paenibacillus odorifer]MEC0223199.1 YraN family protein [Paenibacillus odorifer]OMC94901.1 endonuclease [Paenibacillus odorifer]OMC95320.1 endonuclease [Paenibacillus odorifer]
MKEPYVRKHYNRKEKGTAAENGAVQYLSSSGYMILERNWRCRTGELDIIAEREDCIVVVEVRSRSGELLQGTPEESVNARKINQVRNTTQVYLHMKGYEERRVSFDVISVLLNDDLSLASLSHIREAF